MNDAIGGYFELELKQGEHYHKEALKLNTARNCFEYILRVRGYEKIYIPYYTCNVILEPLKKWNVSYEFYSIDNRLEPLFSKKIATNEAFLYVNYFGLKQDMVERLVIKYGSSLIVDNAQAFYAKPIEGIDTFYSARKFFGVPDGAYLYINKLLDEELESDVSYSRMSHLLKRIDLNAEEGYLDFVNNDNSLTEQNLKQMSKLTERLLRSIDYEKTKDIRLQNFYYMNTNLKTTNRFLFELSEEDVPMVYPYWMESGEKIKREIISKRIYVPTYWPNVFEWKDENSLEYELAKSVIFLPVDQRYTKKELEKVYLITKER